MPRVAVAADVPALVHLINAAFRVEEFFVRGDRTDTQEVVARMAAADSAFFVIDSPMGGELAGAVFVDVRNGRGHFAMLAVDPRRQGFGHGRALVQAAESFCRAAGCREVEIDVVNVRQELPAFYTALGYKAIATAPFPDPAKLHQDAHLVVMTKPLFGE